MACSRIASLTLFAGLATVSLGACSLTFSGEKATEERSFTATYSPGTSFDVRTRNGSITMRKDARAESISITATTAITAPTEYRMFDGTSSRKLASDDVPWYFDDTLTAVRMRNFMSSPGMIASVESTNVPQPTTVNIAGANHRERRMANPVANSRIDTAACATTSGV